MVPVHHRVRTLYSPGRRRPPGVCSLFTAQWRETALAGGEHRGRGYMPCGAPCSARAHVA
eukprot:2580388-Prymnesium_polylepis.1